MDVGAGCRFGTDDVNCTHKARRGGTGWPGCSAAAHGPGRTSGSAGPGSASGPCSACFLEGSQRRRVMYMSIGFHRCNCGPKSYKCAD